MRTPFEMPPVAPFDSRKTPSCRRIPGNGRWIITFKWESRERTYPKKERTGFTYSQDHNLDNKRDVDLHQSLFANSQIDARHLPRAWLTQMGQGDSLWRKDEWSDSRRRRKISYSGPEQITRTMFRIHPMIPVPITGFSEKTFMPGK